MRVPPGFVIRGVSMEDSPILNPLTGETISHSLIHVTAVDPRTGTCLVLDRRPTIQCSFGDVIQDGEVLGFCSHDGLPICTRHSVTDPLCGRTFCLLHSNMVTINEINLRICSECYHKLKDGFFIKVLRLLMGEKR